MEMTRQTIHEKSVSNVSVPNYSREHRPNPTIYNNVYVSDHQVRKRTARTRNSVTEERRSSNIRIEDKCNSYPRGDGNERIDPKQIPQNTAPKLTNCRRCVYVPCICHAVTESNKSKLRASGGQDEICKCCVCGDKSDQERMNAIEDLRDPKLKKNYGKSCSNLNVHDVVNELNNLIEGNKPIGVAKGVRTLNTESPSQKGSGANVNVPVPGDSNEKIDPRINNETTKSSSAQEHRRLINRESIGTICTCENINSSEGKIIEHEITKERHLIRHALPTKLEKYNIDKRDTKPLCVCSRYDWNSSEYKETGQQLSPEWNSVTKTASKSRVENEHNNPYFLCTNSTNICRGRDRGQCYEQDYNINRGNVNTLGRNNIQRESPLTIPPIKPGRLSSINETTTKEDMRKASITSHNLGSKNLDEQIIYLNHSEQHNSNHSINNSSVINTSGTDMRENAQIHSSSEDNVDQRPVQEGKSVCACYYQKCAMCKHREEIKLSANSSRQMSQGRTSLQDSYFPELRTISNRAVSSTRSSCEEENCDAISGGESLGQEIIKDRMLLSDRSSSQLRRITSDREEDIDVYGINKVSLEDKYVERQIMQRRTSASDPNVSESQALSNNIENEINMRKNEVSQNSESGRTVRQRTAPDNNPIENSNHSNTRTPNINKQGIVQHWNNSGDKNTRHQKVNETNLVTDSGSESRRMENFIFKDVYKNNDLGGRTIRCNIAQDPRYDRVHDFAPAKNVLRYVCNNTQSSENTEGRDSFNLEKVFEDPNKNVECFNDEMSELYDNGYLNNSGEKYEEIPRNRIPQSEKVTSRDKIPHGTTNNLRRNFEYLLEKKQLQNNQIKDALKNGHGLQKENPNVQDEQPRANTMYSSHRDGVKSNNGNDHAREGTPVNDETTTKHRHTSRYSEEVPRARRDSVIRFQKERTNCEGINCKCTATHSSYPTKDEYIQTEEPKTTIKIITRNKEITLRELISKQNIKQSSNTNLHDICPEMRIVESSQYCDGKNCIWKTVADHILHCERQNTKVNNRTRPQEEIRNCGGIHCTHVISHPCYPTNNERQMNKSRESTVTPINSITTLDKISSKITEQRSKQEVNYEYPKKNTVESSEYCDDRSLKTGANSTLNNSEQQKANGNNTAGNEINCGDGSSAYVKERPNVHDKNPEEKAVDASVYSDDKICAGKTVPNRIFHDEYKNAIIEEYRNKSCPYKTQSRQQIKQDKLQEEIPIKRTICRRTESKYQRINNDIRDEYQQRTEELMKTQTVCPSTCKSSTVRRNSGDKKDRNCVSSPRTEPEYQKESAKVEPKRSVSRDIQAKSKLNEDYLERRHTNSKSASDATDSEFQSIISKSGGETTSSTNALRNERKSGGLPSELGDDEPKSDTNVIESTSDSKIKRVSDPERILESLLVVKNYHADIGSQPTERAYWLNERTSDSDEDIRDNRPEHGESRVSAIRIDPVYAVDRVKNKYPSVGRVSSLVSSTESIVNGLVSEDNTRNAHIPNSSITATHGTNLIGNEFEEKDIASVMNNPTSSGMYTSNGQRSLESSYKPASNSPKLSLSSMNEYNVKRKGSYRTKLQSKHKSNPYPLTMDSLAKRRLSSRGSYVRGSSFDGDVYYRGQYRAVPNSVEGNDREIFENEIVPKKNLDLYQNVPKNEEDINRNGAGGHNVQGTNTSDVHEDESLPNIVVHSALGNERSKIRVDGGGVFQNIKPLKMPHKGDEKGSLQEIKNTKITKYRKYSSLVYRDSKSLKHNISTKTTTISNKQGARGHGNENAHTPRIIINKDGVTVTGGGATVSVGPGIDRHTPRTIPTTVMTVECTGRGEECLGGKENEQNGMIHTATKRNR